LRFLRFGLVGVVNTAITFAVFNVVAVFLHQPPILGHVLGWLAGFANSFVMNRSWTFRDRSDLPTRQVLPRFLVANLVALASSTAVIAVLDALAESAGLYVSFPRPIVLNAIALAAVGVSLLVNYVLLLRWAFREQASEG
jgi:putative flippase GtrA